MEHRLRTLGKRLRLDADMAPTLLALTESLRPHVHTKREFDDAFEDAGCVDALATRAGLPEGQRALLLRLQAVKDIVAPNPLLDAFFTTIFLAEVALVFRSMAQTDLLGVFIAALFLTDAVTSRVKDAAGVGGRILSAWLHRIGAVDHDPLASRIQLKKWSEQSWQLAVHVGFTIAETVVLMEEPWWNDTSTVWKPHPFWLQRTGGARMDVQVIYVLALVGGGWECGVGWGWRWRGCARVYRLETPTPRAPLPLPSLFPGGVDLHLLHPPLL